MQICCKDKVKCVTGKRAVEVAYIKVISHPELPSKHCLILPQAPHIREFLSVFSLHPMNIEKSRNKSCLAAHLFPHDMEMGSDFFFLINLFILFIYFWLCWVFVVVCGLSLVAASGGYSSLRCTGFSLQ